ncbi:hypothetical protein HGRIS_012723 [Hohenbuehelia grisea]|uniref:Uncharacterized protein n=1 Tax=Hohenbuehelia grisea TaxID=104357 RepID=A0ABR3IT89_9AGAR
MPVHGDAPEPKTLSSMRNKGKQRLPSVVTASLHCRQDVFDLRIFCDMAHSLSEECTPLKHEYDSCFNAWFEGYLEPAIGVASSKEQREAYSKQKASEYEEKCGKLWEQYRSCVQKAVKEKGLDALLEQAREENPLKDPPTRKDAPSS